MPNSVAAAASPPTHRVVAVAYDRLCTFEYGIAAEVFGSRHKGVDGPWYEFRTAAGEPGPLRAHGGLVVAADGGLELLEGADTVILAGWRGAAYGVPEPLSAALRAAYQNGSRVVAICGGAYVLAAAGLLSGRRATTHWHHGGTSRGATLTCVSNPTCCTWTRATS